MHTLYWGPDSCGCVVQYEWDDATTPESARGNFAANAKAAIPCPAHRGLVGFLAVHEAVTEECQLKNLARDHILATVPALAQNVVNLDGTTHIDFKLAVSFVFTEQFVGKGRALTVLIPDATPAQRNAAQAALTARFGPGRVTVS